MKSALPENVRRTILPNGVVILSENMPGQRSAAVGVWLGLGSRHDPVGKAGLAHLYEHMVFKGTTRRTAARISRELESVGGHLNAFTSREQTCFYAKFLGRNLNTGVDLLCDLVSKAKLAPKDLEMERQVVLEEVRACEDDPEELVGDLFAKGLWARHPLGEPISGSIASVEAITREDLLEHQRRSLEGKSPLCVSAAGDVDHDRLVALVTKTLGDLPMGRPDRQPTPRTGKTWKPRLLVERDVSQVNLILARRCLPVADERRHALGLVNLVLGGGMASRLNQQLREKRGLCYSVYSFADFLLGAGAVGISLACEPKQARKAVELVRREVARLSREGLSKRDLDYAREYAKGSSVLGLESPSSRMQHMGKCQFLWGRPVGLDEILARTDAVTLEECNAVAAEFLPEIAEENSWALSAVVPEGFKEELF